MTLGEMIKQYRKENHLTMQEFARRAGMSKGYVSMLEKNRNPQTGRPIIPSLETLTRAAVGMNIEVEQLMGSLGTHGNKNADENKADVCTERTDRTSVKVVPLFGGESRFMACYERLNGAGKKRAEEYLMMLAEMPKYTSQEPEVWGTLPYYDTPVSAGVGEFMDGDAYQKLELLETPPAGAEFVVRVCGNSMEPTYHDGDKLYVASCTDVSPGQIGIFYVNGSAYVKERAVLGLLSHNPEYDPIYFHEADSIRCFGKVLGRCERCR